MLAGDRACTLVCVGVQSWLGLATLVASLPGCSTDDIADDYQSLVGGAGNAAMSGAAGDGAGELLPPAQGMLWLELAHAEGGACSSTRSIEEPEGAQIAITTSGSGERLVDGAGAAIACRVAPRAGAEDAFELDLELSSGSVARFRATGAVDGIAPVRVDVELATGSESLAQTGCEATAYEVLPGAVWLRVSCADLVDASAPGILCAADGGVIFENCATE